MEAFAAAEHGVVMNKCKNCRFWVVHQIAIDDTLIHGELGECRRFPPLGDRFDEDRFTVTHEDDWCGEFKVKKKVDKDAQ